VEGGDSDTTTDANGVFSIHTKNPAVLVQISYGKILRKIFLRKWIVVKLKIKE
jgi:hypothetical protein